MLHDHFNSSQQQPPLQMQINIPQRPTREKLLLPATRPSMAANVTRNRRSSYVASSPRARSVCTCSNHPGSTRCSRHGYLVPRERSKNGNKEVIKRALTPTNRRLSLRWWNFRPTPSRLSNMSMA
ncbi:hypothetical protein OWV82_005001 [Melia azedarach]|uniref:Uncharacterized protein n=1 Tax=Melia azedarach TaxID=155640 RepID=A0ACC1YSY7_MELAZ|nr:hypothetical protein OWV82_005001 [Melia azedarach]